MRGSTNPILCSFEDPGPHGSGRYSENMLPEVEKKDFRKGAQVFFHTFPENLYFIYIYMQNEGITPSYYNYCKI